MKPKSTAPATAATVPPLAILGAAPSFQERLHVGRPNIGDRARFQARLDDMFERRWLTNDGPYVQAFERRVAELCGVRHCIAMANGTIGLEIMLRACGMKGEVIVPSFTFVATAHSLQWQEIRPVFADVDPVTHTLDPRRVEELITPRTTGIVGVHCWGTACDVDGLQEVADRHKLALVFDAAHAFGCSFRGRMIGSFGRAECFSFHATKIVNTFEGGAVTTDDDELAQAMRYMRNFGFAGVDRVVHLGSNGKMPEVCAIMGLTSLDSYEDFVGATRRNWLRYRELLSGLPGLRVYEHDERERHNYHYVVVEIDPEVAPLTRDELVRTLEAENVLARRYFYPGVHRMEPYASEQPMARLVLPITERLSQRVMTLPTGTAVELEAVDRIAALVRRAFQHAPEVRAALAAR